jgi:hypothetical protein
MDAGGFRGLERYLLPSERRVIAVRRHWARLAGPALAALGGLVALMWLDQVLPLGCRSPGTCCWRAGWC